MHRQEDNINNNKLSKKIQEIATTKRVKIYFNKKKLAALEVS